MAFTPQSRANGKFDPITVTMPVTSLVLPQGALVSLAPGANTLAGFVHTTITTVPLLGVTNAPVATTDLFTDITLLPLGTRGLIDISEIINKTTLTATGGSTTTIADSSLKGLPDSTMIGGQVVVVTCAAGLVPGTVLDITGYTQSSGTITFATQTAAMASGDTYQIKRLGVSRLEASNPTSLSTATAKNYVGGILRLYLDQTASTGFGQIVIDADPTTLTKYNYYRWAYVIGTNGDGTKLDIVLASGVDQPVSSS